MKFYIAGAGGMLGEAFYRVLSKKHNLKLTDKNITSDWLAHLDFRDYEKYYQDVSSFRPDWLLHIGAHTSLEYCELNEYDAYMTNTISVEYATRIANSLNIPIFYVSTAGIFDGVRPSYDDWDTPNPLGVYARSKYMGERYVVENANRYIICRAGWMMGGGESKDKKFVQKILKQVKSGAPDIYVVNDKDGTPTYTHDFVKTVDRLIENNAFGLYNCVCSGLTSRFEVASELLKLISRTDINLIQVSSDYFKNDYFATRPSSERLITKRLDILNMNEMRDWKIALSDYLIEYYGIDI